MAISTLQQFVQDITPEPQSARFVFNLNKPNMDLLFSYIFSHEKTYVMNQEEQFILALLILEAEGL